MMWHNEMVHFDLYKRFCEVINKNRHVHSIREVREKHNFHPTFTQQIR
ncbi:hypothetical protein GCM10008967_19640 [Bacillus carboniphilus]|uniref:Uncharacterized protein n=1 Tax=Bacillus carboniphilus TaxID=86663 RepID=A0ABP3FZ89_9BACI